MKVENDALERVINRVMAKQNEVIEQFIETWIAVHIPPGGELLAVKSLIEKTRLCTKLDGTTQKFWLEFKDTP